VILLTAKNTLQAKIEGLEIGADAYVEKPFSPEFLQAQIASLLSNRNKVKAHFASSPLAHIKSMAYNKADEQFLGNLQQIIGKHLDDKMLDVEFLAKQMNMSRPTLYRKISVLSDMSPHELISLTRLKKAAELLLSGNYKVNEVADMLGFSSLANFGRSFSKQFGFSPVEYMKRNSGA
jgi:AraC-like DNA-binding protein